MKNILIKKNIFIFAASFYFGFFVFVFFSAFAQDMKSESYLEKADKLYKAKDYDSAMGVLAEALRRDPGNADLTDKLSQIQEVFQEEKQQEKEKSDKEEIERLSRQAQLYYDKGELDKAIQSWSEILALDPNNSQASWSIQKTQTRLQIEKGSGQQNETDSQKRDYGRKIKNIAEDMLRLIDEAKKKIKEEKEERKRQELAFVKQKALEERKKKLAQEVRRQQKEEAFILDAYRKGQRFFIQEKYDDALKEWETILPLLSKDEELRKSIESMKSFIESKKSGQELPAQKISSEKDQTEKQEAKLSDMHKIVESAEPRQKAQPVVYSDPGNSEKMLTNIEKDLNRLKVLMNEIYSDDQSYEEIYSREAPGNSATDKSVAVNQTFSSVESGDPDQISEELKKKEEELRHSIGCLKETLDKEKKKDNSHTESKTSSIEVSNIIEKLDNKKEILTKISADTQNTQKLLEEVESNLKESIRSLKETLDESTVKSQ